MSPGYAGPQDLDLAVTGVPADALTVWNVNRVSSLKGVLKASHMTHPGGVVGMQASIGSRLFASESLWTQQDWVIVYLVDSYNISRKLVVA